MKIKSIILSIVVLICLISSYFIVNLFLDKNKKLKFENYVLDIDSLIKSESFFEVDSLISSGESLLYDSLSYKRLLKRLYLLKKWDYLILLAEKANTKFPSDKQILSIYIYSLIKLKENEKAFEIIENTKKIIIPEYLKLETNILLDKSSLEDNIFYQIMENDSTYLYSKLFEITNDNNFLINKVLLDLKAGKYDEAEKTLSNTNISDFNVNKLSLLTLYSNQKYDKVLNLLLTYDYKFSDEDLKLIYIDISFKQKLYVKAFNLIEKFLYFYPDYSPDPYINLIHLKNFLDINNMDSYIKSALLYFPTNPKLLYTVVDFYKNNNNEEEAIALIKKYLNNKVNNKEIEIILKQLKGTDNPDTFINNLYEFVNLHPSNTITSRYLAWNLFESNEFIKLKDFLNNFDTAWALFFNALISVNKSDSLTAVDQFQNSFEIEKNWESIFNQGVIYEYNKNYQNAIEFYQNAENLIVNSPENYKIKSLIRTNLAYLYYDIKEYDYAYRQITNAIDQDENNLKAHLLLKKLESSIF